MGGGTRIDKNIAPRYIPQVHGAMLGVELSTSEDDIYFNVPSGVPSITLNAIKAFNAVTEYPVSWSTKSQFPVASAYGNPFLYLNYHDPAQLSQVHTALYSVMGQVSTMAQALNIDTVLYSSLPTLKSTISNIAISPGALWVSCYTLAKSQIDNATTSHALARHYTRVTNRLEAAIDKYAAIASDIGASGFTNTLALGTASIVGGYAEEMMTLSGQVELAAIELAKGAAIDLVQSAIKAEQQWEEAIFAMFQEQTKRLQLLVQSGQAWGQAMAAFEVAYGEYVKDEVKLEEATHLWPLDVSMAFGQLLGVTGGGRPSSISSTSGPSPFSQILGLGAGIASHLV